jgi:hypothetical protein
VQVWRDRDALDKFTNSSEYAEPTAKVREIVSGLEAIDQDTYEVVFDS